MRLQRGRHVVRERDPVDGQRTAGGNLMQVRRPHDEGAEDSHLLVQKTYGVELPVIRPEGIGTDELGETVRLVRRRGFRGAHFVQDDGNACLRDLPSGFRTGQTGAYDMDRGRRHVTKMMLCEGLGGDDVPLCQIFCKKFRARAQEISLIWN